jgi:hypothetical protein
MLRGRHGVIASSPWNNVWVVLDTNMGLIEKETLIRIGTANGGHFRMND